MRGGRSAGRAAVLAVASALLTTVGHLAGGGSVPDLGLFVVLVPLLAGASVTVAGRCRGVIGTLAALGVGQLALHHLMVLLHPAHHEAAGSSGAGMLAGHAAVTALLAVGLSRADRALDAVAAAVRRVLPIATAVLPADRPLPVLAVPGPAVHLLATRWAALAHLRRGPPVGA